MSEPLKKIAGYPENAIAWAMEKLDKKERCAFERTMTKMGSILGKKPEKQGHQNTAI